MNKYIIKLLLFFNLIINCILFIILMFILLVCIYALYDSYQIYESTKIEDDIVYEENPLDGFDYDNVIGWIKVDNTDINYPILKGNDNIEYLTKNYKGEYSFSGSIFLDYRNSSNFEDNYSILYGHSLKKGGMFSDIKKYLDKEFFNDHLSGKLYIKDNTFDISIILVSRIKYNDEVYNLSFKGSEVINYLLSKSINKINIIEKSNKIIIMSTCTSSSKNDRLILVGSLK